MPAASQCRRSAPCSKHFRGHADGARPTRHPQIEPTVRPGTRRRPVPHARIPGPGSRNQPGARLPRSVRSTTIPRTGRFAIRNGGRKPAASPTPRPRTRNSSTSIGGREPLSSPSPSPLSRSPCANRRRGWRSAGPWRPACTDDGGTQRTHRLSGICGALGTDRTVEQLPARFPARAASQCAGSATGHEPGRIATSRRTRDTGRRRINLRREFARACLRCASGYERYSDGNHSPPGSRVWDHLHGRASRDRNSDRGVAASVRRPAADLRLRHPARDARRVVTAHRTFCPAANISRAGLGAG